VIKRLRNPTAFAAGFLLADTTHLPKPPPYSIVAANMAITRNAKKAHRASLNKRVFNIRTKATLHDVVKNFRTTVTKGAVTEAEALLPTVFKAIDKAAKRGVIKDNTASRKKSRLVASLRKVVVK
jgi:small subunit ribosomal protein S20